MKDILYGPALAKDRNLLALAQQRSEQLEDVVGSFAPSVTAEWDRALDAGAHPLVTLRLSDWSGSVTAVMEPKELESDKQMRGRFNFLWADLLGVRSQKHLERLLASD